MESVSTNENEGQAPKTLKVLPSDGPRLSNVKASLQATLDRLYAEWKVSLLQKCYPSISNNRILLESLLNKVLEAAKSEIEEGLSEVIETELEGPLQTLSGLVSTCKLSKGTRAWRPSREPLKDLAAHDKKVLEHEKQKLLEAVSKQRQVTAALKEDVQALRCTVEDNNRKLTEREATMDHLAAVCDTVEREIPASLPDFPPLVS